METPAHRPPANADQVLEIIRVRCSAEEARRAEKSLRELLASLASPAVRLYRNAATPHDLALHLAGEARPGAASALGLQIAASLRDFGPVSHSLWAEIHANFS